MQTKSSSSKHLSTIYPSSQNNPYKEDDYSDTSSESNKQHFQDSTYSDEMSFVVANQSLSVKSTSSK